MSDIGKWRGLKDLVRDAVEHGASAVERIHRENAKVPFAVLQQIAPLQKSAKNIERAHDAIVAASYESVRAVTRLLGQGADAALDAIEKQQAQADQDVIGASDVGEPGRAPAGDPSSAT